MRTLLYEAANVMLTRYKGQLKLKDWAFAIARRSKHAQGARRSGASPRHHHARHAVGRNGVHLGVGLPTTETGDRIELPQGATREGGSRRRRGFCSQRHHRSTAFSTLPLCPSLPIKRQRARRERRHPKRR